MSPELRSPELYEHQGLAYWCPHCRKVHYAPIPEPVVKGGLFGPRLTALVAFMKGVCHASFSTIRKFLRDVVRVKVSRGYLAKLIGKVSEALAGAYAELFERLPGEAVLNIDETGHKENGQKFWTWCFRAQMYTLFRIDKSRGSWPFTGWQRATTEPRRSRRNRSGENAVRGLTATGRAG